MVEQLSKLVKIGICVEGQSEALFVKYVLSRYLFKHNIHLQDPVILGGNVNLPRISQFLSIMAPQYDFITTLYDFYGFQGKNDHETADALELRIKQDEKLISFSNIIPYIQKYEFETLLFSDLNILVSHLYHDPELKQQCLTAFQININGKEPEDINDSIATAPSKRIHAIYRRYKKSLLGYIIAQDIGIEKIKERCPRFNKWLDSLIALANNS